jgi:hypothetical protein
MDAKQFESIELGTTDPVVINCTDDEGFTSDGLGGLYVWFLVVVSGSIKFGIDSIHANAPAFAEGEYISPVTARNGRLVAKGNASTDTFYFTFQKVN